MKFRQITKINNEKYNGKVYDLTVEDVHSYNIDSLVVHNSAAGSLILFLLGITKQIDPIQNELLFFRFLTEDRKDPPDWQQAA